MTAQLIDGNALSRQLRTDVAARVSALKARGHHAWSGRDPGRRKRRLAGVCAQQGQGLRRHRHALRAGKLASRHERGRPAGTGGRAEQRHQHPRHPGSTAVARPHRRPKSDRSHLACQRRGRFPHRQRRRTDDRPAWLLALHTLWLHENAGIDRLRPQGQTCRRDRSQQHRGQAHGH